VAAYVSAAEKKYLAGDREQNMKHLLTLAAVAICSGALAVDFFELEANDSKATANVVSGMAHGDRIIGNSILGSGTGLDYFRVSTATDTLGIYRYRLTINSAIAGHTGSLRGLNQIASAPDTLAGTPWDGVVGTAGTTDTTLQSTSTATTPPRYNQWYGFGNGGEIYYRVAGVAATTADYESTLERVAVTPTDIGTYNEGMITLNSFNQGHSSDTDMWVYDSNFNAMVGYGNDDESVLGGSPGTGGSLQSWLARNYTVGRYYVAISNFHLANNMASPSDDDFRTGTLLDFGGVIANSSTTVNLNMAFTISDGVTSFQVANTKAGAYDVNWFTFNVVPEPGTYISLGTGLALLALARRRRK
jgi:hypothetical protein